jgi:hypothetical protein
MLLGIEAAAGEVEHHRVFALQLREATGDAVLVG